MVNNYTNIKKNQMNNHLLPQIIKHKKIMICGIENPGPGLEQVQVLDLTLRIVCPKGVYIFYQHNLNFFFPANKTRLTYSIMIKLKINNFKIIINQGLGILVFNATFNYI